MLSPCAHGFVDSSTIKAKQSTYTPRYLNTLRQYMPHVTDAQRSDVVVFDGNPRGYTIDGWTSTADASQFAAAVSTFVSQVNATRQNTSISRAAQTKQLKPLGKAVNDQWVAYVQTGKTDYYTAACAVQYDSSKLTDEKAAKLRSGSFLSFASHDYTAEYNKSAPGITAWLSDSFQNDTVIRSAYLDNRVTYYGENVFRGSALEIVVFPDVWPSDHALSYCDTPARTKNGLVFGKEAVIIEANSFADCANLKSVIVFCEPARLYLADGVFKNCPNLTVYAPAGGTLESYCKANGIKFQAMTDGYLEPRIDEAAILKSPVAWTTADEWGDTWTYYKKVPAANYEPDAATMNNYTNGIGVVRYGNDGRAITAEQMTMLRKDINRCRSDDIRNSALVFMAVPTNSSTVGLRFMLETVPYGSFSFPTGTKTWQYGW